MREQPVAATGERILAAAAAMIAEEGVAARLSVRAVAARAEVSIGSLRHHFPTQQALRDAVIERIGGWLASDDWIRDRSLPARERLFRSLHQVLAASGHGRQARDAMVAAINTFVVAEQTPAVRAAYLAVERDGQRRIERWLNQLADEGLTSRANVARKSRFLATVLNGLALQRAFPGVDGLLEVETATLETAVAAVLGP